MISAFLFISILVCHTSAAWIANGKFDVSNTSVTPSRTTSAITPKPTLKQKINENLTATIGQKSVRFLCPVTANPVPHVSWQKDGHSITHSRLKRKKMDLMLYNITEQDAGSYTCVAQNEFGALNVTYYLSVVRDHNSQESNVDKSRISNTVEVNDDSNVKTVAEKPRFKSSEWTKTMVELSGKSVKFDCLFEGRPEPNITWIKDGDLFYRFNGEHYEMKAEGYLYLENISPSDEGNYTCIISNEFGSEMRTFSLEVESKIITKIAFVCYSFVFPHNSDFLAMKPIFNDGKLANVTVEIGGNATLECQFMSDVEAQFGWFRIFHENSSSQAKSVTVSIRRVVLPNRANAHILELINVTHEDEGWYACYAVNAYGKELKEVYVNVIETSEPTVFHLQPHNNRVLWIIAPAVCVVIVIFFLCLLAKERKKQITVINAQKSFIIKKKVLLLQHDPSDKADNFLAPIVKINCETVNCEMSVDELSQATTEYELPLDPKWEFPRNQLTLGKVLGAGAFGVVRQAEAVNLHGSDSTNIVAVKMCKDGHSDADIKDLISEMEVMKKIGTHINIINLLACCTQNGPLMVIVEYAANGNLRDFLRNQRPNYGYETAIGEVMRDSLSYKNLLSFAYQVRKVQKRVRKKIARGMEKTTDGRLPVKWMAPETLVVQKYTTKSD
ncbi:Fibroblast growth factor receptor 3-like protein, partial [Leptotrombidium deliense]